MNNTDTALQLTGITKSFGDLVANNKVSLSLRKGEILALLGENGAGKTTLMNILFGHYTADQGEISVFGEPLPPGSPQAALEHGIGMVHQHFTLAENMTALDNITLGTEPLFAISRKRGSARKKIGQLSKQFGLEVNPSAKIKQLSVGERQRVEILKALYRDSRILILDEPTAVLTPQECETLFVTLRLLAKQGLAVIFISHKLKEVISVSDRCCVLRHGAIVAEKETEETTAEELATAMVGGTIPKPEKITIQQGQSILQLKNTTVSDSNGGNGLNQASLSLHQGEILGIAGVSGNGQSELADLISGLATPDSGEVFFEGKQLHRFSPGHMAKMGIGRIPEDRTAVGLIGDMNIQENLILEQYKSREFTSYGFLKFSQMNTRAHELIKRFDVRCPGPMTTTRQLSGGNMQKLILSRVLAEQPKVILACQPTWGLDVGATAFVHSQLLNAAAEGAAIILISEDLDEIFAVADKVQVIYHGRLTPPVKPDSTSAESMGMAMSGHADVIEVNKEFSREN